MENMQTIDLQKKSSVWEIISSKNPLGILTYINPFNTINDTPMNNTKLSESAYPLDPLVKIRFQINYNIKQNTIFDGN